MKKSRTRPGFRMCVDYVPSEEHRVSEDTEVDESGVCTKEGRKFCAARAQRERG